MIGLLSKRGLIAAALAATLISSHAAAVPFTSQYTDGEHWNTLFAQGFSPSQTPMPDPGLATDAVVPLDRFQFFKGGNADSAMNFRLAIVSNFFFNLNTFTMSSPELVGLSTNAIASTTGIATGAPITFNFDGLPLTYGSDYAAIFVTEGAEGALAPVLVSTLDATYIEDPPGSGIFRPESDYGDPDVDYFKAASNFINENEFGRFLAAFNAPHADGNFIASFDLPDEALPGDYNADNAVNGLDLAVWGDQFGTVGGTSAADGDGDGDVDGADFLLWQGQFGATAAAPAAGGVPEPAAWTLALVGMALASARVRRRR